MRRLLSTLAAVFAAALPASVVAVTVATAPAAAAQTIHCSKLTGTITGAIVVSGCSPKNKHDKSVTGLATKLATGGPLKWSPSRQTTVIAKPTETSPGQGSCPTGDTEYVANGKVTGGTSSYTKKGQTFSAEVCVAKNDAISLVPGSRLSL